VEKSGKTSVNDLIASRRTIHDFKSEPIPDIETILSSLEVARWAPNHRLTEPWHFYLLEGEIIEKICQFNAEITRRKNGAAAAEMKLARWREMPGWLIVTCKKSEKEVRFREDYAACCCVIQNLMLSLWSQGIGMKWSTGEITRMPEFYELIGIDIEQELVVGLFWYGYPEVVPETRRTVLEDVLTYLS